MYRWLLVALAGYIIYRMFKNDFKAKADKRGAGEAARRDSGDMARDPVCGTFVDMAESITVRNGEKVYYFCGYDCRDEFLQRMRDGESPEAIETSSRAAQAKHVEKDDTPPSSGASA